MIPHQNLVPAATFVIVMVLDTPSTNSFCATFSCSVQEYSRLVS